jgi:hypothetical protein
MNNTPTPLPVQKKTRRAWRYWLPAVLLAGLIAWPWITLHFNYSDGERVGVLQKLSRKGWICKTYEGEIAMYVVGGVAPQIWNFTVRDRKVAEALNNELGQRVRLHYEEHRGVPSSCFGDTVYFVDRGAAAPQ